MAIDISFGSHGAFFPAKVASAQGTYSHVYNMVLDADTDNGVLAGRGDYVSFDQYKTKATPAGFAGKIIDTAANGNFYVEVTALDASKGETVVLYNPSVSEYEERDLRKESLFYNKSGEVVQGMTLIIGDVLELSAQAFNGTPAVGKNVTFASGKYVVAA